MKYDCNEFEVLRFEKKTEIIGSDSYLVLRNSYPCTYISWQTKDVQNTHHMLKNCRLMEGPKEFRYAPAFSSVSFYSKLRVILGQIL